MLYVVGVCCECCVFRMLWVFVVLCLSYVVGVVFYIANLSQYALL